MIQDDPAFPAMKHLFAAYFHQDWEDDAATSHEVIADFLNLERPTPDQLRTLEAGIRRLIESYPESELRSVLYESLGSYYGVIAPETFTSWLTEVATQLRQAADE